jgi:hypothetical protein
LLRASSITALAAALASTLPLLVRERACADTKQWQATDAGQLCMQQHNQALWQTHNQTEAMRATRQQRKQQTPRP